MALKLIMHQILISPKNLITQGLSFWLTIFKYVLTFWDITCTDTAVIPSSVADIITCMTSWITIHYHIYADDKQIYEYDDVCISEINVSLQRLNDCVSEVGDLCASRQLQLNISKTELAWFGSRTNMQQEGWLSPTERASVSAHFGLHRVCLWNNRGKFT